MILSKNHPQEACRYVIDVGLLQLPRLKVSIVIRVKGNPSQLFPIIGLVDFDLELDFGGNLALMGKDCYLELEREILC